MVKLNYAFHSSFDCQKRNNKNMSLLENDYLWRRRLQRDRSSYDFNNPCDWNCCVSHAHLDVDRKYFWSCMDKMKQNDKSYVSSSRLIYERTIDLNSNDKSIRSALCIGLVPENKFQVAARIYIHGTGECLSLDSKEFKGLMDVMEFEKERIFTGTQLRNLTATQAKRYKIQICLTNEQNKFELIAHNDRIHIDLLTLERLCEVRDYITRIRQALEQRSSKYETEFFKLMSHFYYDKTVNEACTECENTQKREIFFEKIINFHCDCLDKAFLLEIALNCEMWFGLCIPFFIKSLMLNEFYRWQTFASSSNWPQTNKISTRLMSKSGFYYSGTMDNTICAFCGLNLHDWKEGDIPILVHNAQDSSCLYLYNHSETMNVDRDKKTLKKIMSALDNK